MPPGQQRTTCKESVSATQYLCIDFTIKSNTFLPNYILWMAFKVKVKVSFSSSLKNRVKPNVSITFCAVYMISSSRLEKLPSLNAFFYPFLIEPYIIEDVSTIPCFTFSWAAHFPTILKSINTI